MKRLILILAAGVFVFAGNSFAQLKIGFIDSNTIMASWLPA